MNAFANDAPVPRLDEIRVVTAAYFGLRKSDMTSKCRKRRVARPRQIAMALTRELTSHSLPKIGRQYGGRDHTTVLHACRRIASLENENRDVALDVAAVRRAIFKFIAPERGARPEPMRAEEAMHRIMSSSDAIAVFFQGMDRAAARDKLIQLAKLEAPKAQRRPEKAALMVAAE